MFKIMKKDKLILLIGIILIIIWNAISYGIVDAMFTAVGIMVLYGIARILYRISMKDYLWFKNYKLK